MILSTFSLVARCPRSGMLGGAVATRVPAVGASVPHVEAAVGAIASQAWSNPYLGIHGLRLLRTGMGAREVMRVLTTWDPDAPHRQVSIVDAEGATAAFTGASTKPHAGHREGDGVVVAGNLLAGPAVLEAMLERYQSGIDLPFELRLLAALEAGERAGGDARGRQSAALKVMWREAYPYVDVRVDDHHDPVSELGRLYAVCERDLFPFRERRPRWSDLTARAGGPLPGVVDDG